MVQVTQVEKGPEGPSAFERGGNPPLFLDDTFIMGGLILGRVDAASDLGSIEQDKASYLSIAQWCSNTQQPEGRCEEIVRSYNGLQPGQRVFHDGYMHGGTLQAGKTAIEESHVLANGSIHHGLWFMLPVATGNNPEKVKNLPISPDNLVVGDDNIVAALRSRLLEPTKIDERSIFSAETYIKVAWSMKSLGWDVSSDQIYRPDLEQLRNNIREFTKNSFSLWIDRSSVLPGSLLTSLLKLSNMLGDAYISNAENSLAVHVAKCAELTVGKFRGDEKIVAFYTSFLQGQQNSIITREQARKLLTERGNRLLA